MMEDAFYTPAHLHEIGLVWNSAVDMEEQQLLARKNLDFVLVLAGFRAWSMLVSECPPYTWAGILTDKAERKAAGMCDGSGFPSPPSIPA